MRVAEAIRRAIDMASGGGTLVNEPDDEGGWLGSKPGPGEKRGKVILWLSDKVLVFGRPEDGTNSYARVHGETPMEQLRWNEMLDRYEAVARFTPTWEDPVHLGAKLNVPVVAEPVEVKCKHSPIVMLDKPAMPHQGGST